MNILTELWYGNISPCEHHIPDTRHTLELREQALHYSEELQGMLSAEARQMMQKLQDCTDALDDVREQELFAYGFRIGARVMLEVMQGTANDHAKPEP